MIRRHRPGPGLGHGRAQRRRVHEGRDRITQHGRDSDLGHAAYANPIEFCLRFAGAPGIVRAHAQTLLARSSLNRVHGSPAEALRDVREAGLLAAALPDDRHLKGLIALREGGVHLVVGDAGAALHAYQEALRRRAAETSARAATGPAASILDASVPGHDTTVGALGRWPGGCRPIERLAELGPAEPCGLLYAGAHGQAVGEGQLLGTGIDLHGLADAALPKLVVLCSCWSGAAESRYGRDPLSLAVGALLGGADTVIAGAGPIGMLASAQITAATLESLQESATPAGALRDAQLRFARDNEGTNLFEWAGLRVVGLG